MTQVRSTTHPLSGLHEQEHAEALRVSDECIEKLRALTPPQRSFALANLTVGIATGPEGEVVFMAANDLLSGLMGMG